MSCGCTRPQTCDWCAVADSEEQTHFSGALVDQLAGTGSGSRSLYWQGLGPSDSAGR